MFAFLQVQQQNIEKWIFAEGGGEVILLRLVPNGEWVYSGEEEGNGAPL